MNATVLILLLTAGQVSLSRPAPVARPAPRVQADVFDTIGPRQLASAATVRSRDVFTTIDDKSADVAVINLPPLYDVPNGYPLRGRLWSGLGGSREAAINHLMQGFHGGKFSREYLEGLSYLELSALHSDDHEHRVQMAYVKRPAKAAAYFSVPQASCPGGRCPR